MITAVNTSASASSASDNSAAAERIDAATTDPDGRAQTAASPSAAETEVSISAQGAQRAQQASGTASSSTASAATTGGLSSVGRTYEPADTNQDGVVTPKEQSDYNAKLATQKSEEAARNARATPEADAAVREYEAIGQLSPGQAGGSAAA